MCHDIMMLRFLTVHKHLEEISVSTSKPKALKFYLNHNQYSVITFFCVGNEE